MDFVPNAIVGLAGTTAVTLTGAGVDLGVVDRRTITVRDSQPYHDAQGLDLEAATRVIDEAFARAVSNAVDALRALTAELAAKDVAIVGVGLSFKEYKLPSAIEVRLRSHAMCHGAEGMMTRDALWAACEHLGLPVHAEPPRAVPATIAAAGKPLGAPWRKEHKLAAMAALARLGY